MSVMNLHRRQDGESRLASESDASLINTGFFSPFTGRAAGIPPTAVELIQPTFVLLSDALPFGRRTVA